MKVITLCALSLLGASAAHAAGAVPRSAIAVISDTGSDLLSPGGYTRAAALAGALAQLEGRGLLLLSPGGVLPDKKTLTGAEATLFKTFGAGAANVAPREASLALTAKDTLPFISANLLSAGGKAPFPAHVIVASSGEKFACFGASSPALLRVDEAAAGQWKLAPPAAALAKAAAGVDPAIPRILLFYGSDDEAVIAARAIGASLVVVGASTSTPAKETLGDTTIWRSPSAAGKIAACPWNIAEGKIRLGPTFFTTVSEAGPSAMPSATPAADEVQRKLVILLEKEGLVRPRPTAGPRPAASPAEPPAELTADLTFPVRSEGKNKACVLTVGAVELTRSWRGAAPQQGTWAVVDTAWENRHPYQLVKNSLEPVAYQVTKLSDHLYLRVDGRFTIPLKEEDNPLLGEAPHVFLPRKGSRKDLRIAFRLPALARRSLSLLFLDSHYGHIELLLWGRPPPEPPLVRKPVKNPYLGFGVAAVKEVDEVAGRKAGEGRRLLLVELAGTSEIQGSMRDRAVDFVVKYAPDEFVQLVEEDTYAAVPLDVPLPYRFHGEAPFLPGVPSHGYLVFSVPADHGRLALHVFMPAKRRVESGKLGDVKAGTLVVPLGGEKKPPAAITDELASFDDGGILKLTFAKPSRSGDLLLVTCSARNAGEEPEIFRPLEQVLLAEGGKQRKADAALTARLARSAPEKLRIPPGASRRATVAFSAEGTPQAILYRGFTRAETMPLEGAAGGAVAVRPAPLETPREAERTAQAAPAAKEPQGAAPSVGAAVEGFRPASVTVGPLELSVLALGTGKTFADYGRKEDIQYVAVSTRWTLKEPVSGAWKSRLLSDNLYLHRRGLFLLPAFNIFGVKKGVLPPYVKLEKPGDAVAGLVVFKISEGPIDGSSLVFDGGSQGAISVPLVRARKAAPSRVVARAKNDALDLAVLEVVDLDAEMKKTPSRDRSFASSRFLGLRLRATALVPTLELPGAERWLQVVAGGSLVPRWYEPETTTVQGWPTWRERRRLPAGIPDHGMIVVAVPRGDVRLDLEAYLPDIRQASGKTLTPAPIVLPVVEGKHLAARAPVARIRGQGATLSLLGIHKDGTRDKDPSVVLDLSLDGEDGAKPYEFVLDSDVEVVDPRGVPWSSYRFFGVPKRLRVPPGAARSFTLGINLRDNPGSRLWLSSPRLDPVSEIVISNPWVDEDMRRLESGVAPQIVRIEKNKEGKKTGRYTPPPLFPEPPAKGIRGVGLTAAQVNDAIKKGALFLIRQTGGKFNTTRQEDCLVVLALLHSRELENHPDVMAAAVDLLLQRKIQHVYDAALVIMALAMVDPVAYRPRIQQLAQLIVDGQGKNGGWSYLDKQARKIPPQDTSASAKGIRVFGGAPIPGWPGTEPPPAVDLHRTPPVEGGGDNSCSQYAVIGLQAADAAGVRAPPATWEGAAKWFLEGQDTPFGWGYGQGSDSYGSMTTAGLVGLAVARFHLGGKPPEAERTLREGVDWLGRNFRVDANPLHSSYHFYYLYGLERAGRLLGKKFLGTREWYAEGARYLVDSQSGDGSWTGRGNSAETIKDTAYALLFLTLATEELGKAAVQEGPGKLAVRTSGLGGTVEFILDASGSMTAPMGDGTRFTVARDVILEVLKGSGKELNVALRVYGHRYSALDKRADKDSELLVDLGPASRVELAQGLAKIRCRGKTPLTYSLRQAVGDLGGRGEGKRRVILLTDGLESDRKADPAKAAAALKDAGVQVDVVCFAMDDPERLDRVSRAGGGSLYAASDGAELRAAVRSALLGVVPFRVLGPGDAQVAAGMSGETLDLPAGPYTVAIELPGQPVRLKAWVHQDRTTSVIISSDVLAAGGAGKRIQATPAAGPKERPEAAKFCTQCGARLRPGALFCTQCGTKVKK